MEIDLGKCATALLTQIPFKGATLWVGCATDFKSGAKLFTVISVGLL